MIFIFISLFKCGSSQNFSKREHKTFWLLCEFKMMASQKYKDFDFQDGLGPQIPRPFTFRLLLYSVPPGFNAEIDRCKWCL